MTQRKQAVNKIHEYIGVDLGMRKSGLARGNSTARLAEPLAVVPTESLVEHLQDLIDDYQASAVVVGLPRGLDGQETQQTKWARAWASEASAKIKTVFYWQDEALSSRRAAKIQNSKFKDQSLDEDALAAAVILQDFLNAPESERFKI